MDKKDLSCLTIEEIEEIVLGYNEKKFRGKQIYEWIHKKNISEFDEMTNISKPFINILNENFCLTDIEILKKLSSNLDNTTKYLFRINGNNIIESVLMNYSFGSSVCVSSQAGCKMGCAFCASTLNGLERNLTAGEMLGQVYKIQKDISQRIGNIVIMGSGEPLDNYDNTLRFINTLSSEEGLNIGERHITLSTCGIVDKIYKLMNENLKINLAVSLHAPNDEIRSQIMPVSKRYKFDDLLKACFVYSQKTKRRVTFEYALISGINDKPSHAAELGKKLKSSLSHVNLIPVNDVKERNFKSVSNDVIYKFANELKNFGIETTVRRKLGSDINASCGQLRNEYLSN